MKKVPTPAEVNRRNRELWEQEAAEPSGPPTVGSLNAVLRILNRAPQDLVAPFSKTLVSELKKLVDMWLASGPNTAKMLRENPGCLPNVTTCKLVPTDTGRMIAAPFPIAAMHKSPEDMARTVFLQFVVSEDSMGSGDFARLGGPCACGCGRYFERKSKHNKTFCDGHGSAHFASKAMTAKQEEKRRPRVKAVNRAIEKYNNLRKRGDWKTFVGMESNVPPNTLERWVKKGFIAAPTKQKGR